MKSLFHLPPQRAKTGRRAQLLLPGAFVAAAVLLAGCRLDMHEQPKFKPLRENDFYADMRSSRSIPKLTEALSDKDPVVVLSAAHSLLLLHDHQAYDVYYAVLTGQRKAGRGLIAQQRAKLDDPKKLAVFGVETGLGFVPFGGIGVSAYKLITKNGSDEIRAAAAEVLAKDPDPESRTALIDALTDRSDLVRIAALKAIAMRDDPKLLKTIEPSMDDEKDTVQYVAAAAVLRLAGGMKASRTEVSKPERTAKP